MEKTAESKIYEVSFLGRSEKELETVRNFLKEFRAEPTGEESVTKIKLAYPIKKELFAFFGWLRFYCPPDLVGKIGKSLSLNGGILRFLIVSDPAVKETPFEKSDSEKSPVKKESSSPAAGPGVSSRGSLSNEALEKTLKEILE